jgi:hypothetical protein
LNYINQYGNIIALTGRKVECLHDMRASRDGWVMLDKLRRSREILAFLGFLGGAMVCQVVGGAFSGDFSMDPDEAALRHRPHGP